MLDRPGVESTDATGPRVTRHRLDGPNEVFGQAFRLLSEGVLVIDSVGRVLSVNPAACALLERTERELLTPDYLLQLDARTETGLAIPAEQSFGTKVLATGNPVRDVKVSVANRTGSRIWLSASYQPLTCATGEAVGGMVLSLRGRQSSANSGSSQTRATTRAREGRLTDRERDVVALIALGRTTGEISTELYISPATVRTHVRNAMTKTRSRSRAQLVALTLSG
jgi:DNA-binding CsgD family transcriptional regulator